MFLNNLITRFPNGLNVAANGPDDIFNSLGYPDYVGSYRRFEDDFYTYTAGQWTITNVAGTGAVARANGNGGLITITTDANNNDGTQMQRIASGVSGLSYLINPAKPFFMDIVASLDVLTANAYLGLAVTDTTIIGGVTDGLAFRLATGGALTLVAEKNSVEASVAIGTITAGVPFRLSAFYDGQGAVNGMLYGALNGVVGGGVVAGPSIDDDELTTLSFALQTLSAAAKVLTIDRAIIIQPM